MNYREELEKQKLKEQKLKNYKIGQSINIAAAKEEERDIKVHKQEVRSQIKTLASTTQRVHDAPIQVVEKVMSRLGTPQEAMRGVGGEILKLAKTSRQKLLEGPDGLITKDPVMRARYLPSRGARQGVNLRTIHDVNLNNFKKMDLTRQVEKHL